MTNLDIFIFYFFLALKMVNRTRNVQALS